MSVQEMKIDLILIASDTCVNYMWSRLKPQDWSLGSTSTYSIFQKWLQSPVLPLRVTPSAAPAKLWPISETCYLQLRPNEAHSPPIMLIGGILHALEDGCIYVSTISQESEASTSHASIISLGELFAHIGMNSDDNLFPRCNDRHFKWSFPA